MAEVIIQSVRTVVHKACSLDLS